MKTRKTLLGICLLLASPLAAQEIPTRTPVV